MNTANININILERETGFEPATSSLEERRSTTELLPPTFAYKHHQSNPLFFYVASRQNFDCHCL